MKVKAVRSEERVTLSEVRDVLAGVELLFDLGPRALVLSTLLGQDQTAVLVLLLENQGLDLITA